MKRLGLRGLYLALSVLFVLSSLAFARTSDNGQNQRYNDNQTVKVGEEQLRTMYTLPDQMETEGKILYRFKKSDRSMEFSPAQVAWMTHVRQAMNSKEDPVPTTLDFGWENTLQVPGGGDIFDMYHNPFDSAAMFDEYTLVDLNGNGNDWFAFDLYDDLYGPQYTYLNAIIAPTPGPNGDFNENAGLGHPDPISPGPKDYAAEIKFGVPEVDSTGTPYRVASAMLDLWLENDDYDGDGDNALDDYLIMEIAEPAKWHIANGEWAMTSNQYSVPGYGNEWREDLRTPVIDLSGASGAVTLTFDHMYDMESAYWDGGTIWARADESSEWEVVTPAGGYTSDGGLYSWFYHGIASSAHHGEYGDGVNEIPGFTGHLGSYETVTVDLSAYAGSSVQIRWAFASDLYYSAEAGNDVETLGWFVDNIEVSDGSGTIFSNDGSSVGEMEAVRLGPGETGPWQAAASWYDTEGGQSLSPSIDLTQNIIGAPGDSLGLRFRAIFDGNDDGASAFWGFEISEVLVQAYTRLARDLSVTFADFGADSVLTTGGFVTTGTEYDIRARVSNAGLSDFAVYDVHAVVENANGDEVYHRNIYTYRAGQGTQGDSLYAYPDYQDIMDGNGFYDFPNWTPQFEGDYTLKVYTKLFTPDDNTANDTLVHHFHAYTAEPAFFADFNDPTTPTSLLNNGWSFETVHGTNSLEVADYFGNGDTEIWWTSFSGAVAADNNHETLISPMIDCSGGSDYGLRFEQHLFAAGHPAWILNIKVSNDGTNWTTVKSSNGASPYGARHGIFLLDISEVADGQSTVQVALEFVFEDTLAEVNPYGYSTIDDISVYAGADISAADVVANVAAESGDMQATITWDGVDGDNMYYGVYRADTSDIASAAMVGNVTETMYIDEGLTNGETYYYWVTAVDHNLNESTFQGEPASVTPADVDAPSTIEDLAVTNISPTKVMLSWTSPMETMPEEGSYYEIKYAHSPIVDGASGEHMTGWMDAEMVADVPAFEETDAAQSVTIGGLTPEIDTYFAIKTTDESGNVSALSNVVNNDDEAPARVSDLQVKAFDDASITFEWTAPGDDGNTGMATEYDFRVAYGADLTDWETAVPLTGEPMPEDAGTNQVFVASEDVYPNFALAFAVVAIDNNGNASAMSNVVKWRPNGVVPPTINMVEDVPEDQGHQVRVDWTPSENEGDEGNLDVTAYSIWRMVEDKSDEAGENSKTVAGYLELFNAAPEATSGERYKVLNPDNTMNSMWDFVATVPAHHGDAYSAVAPTLYDSTMTDGMHESTFMVSAHSELGYTANSAPMSGYSVDNLAPGVVQNISGSIQMVEEAAAVVLSWDENADEYLDKDLAEYTIYRSDTEDMNTLQPVGSVTEATFTDASVETEKQYYYAVTASDFAGNESEFSDLTMVNVVVGIAGESQLPEDFMLSQNYPNPFNPSTRIQFALPEAAQVTLTVYNMAGQKVVDLVNTHMNAGYHTVEWNGRDQYGNSLSSGIYIYRLRAGDYQQTMKMAYTK